MGGCGLTRVIGLLKGTPDALLVVRAENQAEIESRLAADPWTASGLLALKQIAPWDVRIGKLP